MLYNYEFDSVSTALPRLARELLANGDRVVSRAGKTLELPYVSITLREPWRREVVIFHRKPNLAAQIAETMWVLAGRNDIAWLSNYLPRAGDFSDDGKTWRAAYGPRIRSWPRRDGSGDTLDQLAWVVDHLSREPGSRRAVISLWDPVVDTQAGLDIPCNDWLHFLVRDGALHLHVAVRSNDFIWGWSGINTWEWSALLEVVAGLLGLRVGTLNFSTSSFHIYEHHWDRAERLAESRPGKHTPSPAFYFDKSWAGSAYQAIDWLDYTIADWMVLEEKIRKGDHCEYEVNDFPEPMFQSWLRVIQWWWTGNRDYLAPLRGTALYSAAVRYSVQPPSRKKEEESPTADTRERKPFPDPFTQYVLNLHLQKDAAYGDSWKKRGELLSILPNIARKVDRLLVGGETADENLADTAVDLLVYLAKYSTWLAAQAHPSYRDPSDNALEANALILDQYTDQQGSGFPADGEMKNELKVLAESFESVAEQAERKDPVAARRATVDSTMLPTAYRLARAIWEKGHGQSSD